MNRKIEKPILEKFLRYVYPISGTFSKHGKLRLIESMGMNGGNYELSIVNAKGSPVTDPSIWREISELSLPR